MTEVGRSDLVDTLIFCLINYHNEIALLKGGIRNFVKNKFQIRKSRTGKKYYRIPTLPLYSLYISSENEVSNLVI